MTLDSKSPEPQGFGEEGTLGILFVSTGDRVVPDFHWISSGFTSDKFLDKNSKKPRYVTYPVFEGV